MHLFKKSVEKLKAKGDVAGLVKVLRDAHPDMRALTLHEVPDTQGEAISALLELGGLRDPEAVEPLARVLGDSILLISWDPRTKEPLPDAAKRHPDLAVRQGAAMLLGRLGAPAARPLVAALADSDPVREEAMRGLEKIGAPAVDPLTVALHHPDWGIRSRAAEALGRVGVAEGVAPLVTALAEDEDAYVRSGAAEALGHIGGPAAVDALVSALGDPDETVRMHAAFHLDRLGGPEAERALKEYRGR